MQNPKHAKQAQTEERQEVCEMSVDGLQNNHAQKSVAGFSLVEVTLALLVVAVGLTATLALFPEGLTATREAVNNTETALFADYVFTSLELSAAYQSLFGKMNETDLVDGTDDFISHMFSETVRKSEGKKKFQLEFNQTATFYWMPDYYGLGSGDMDSDFFEGMLTTAVFTYELFLEQKGGSGTPFKAVLKVWPGEFDKKEFENYKDDMDARIFYREILPPL